MSVEEVLVLAAAVLRGAIAVMDEARSGAASSQGVAQRLESQFVADAVGRGPTDDAPGEDVEEDGEEEPALARADLRDVGDPESVGCFRGEVSLHEVGSRGEIAARCGDAPETLGRLAAQALQAHEPRDAMLSGRHAGDAQRAVHARRSIDAAVLTMNRSNALHERVVIVPTRARARGAAKRRSRCGRPSRTRQSWPTGKVSRCRGGSGTSFLIVHKVGQRFF